MRRNPLKHTKLFVTLISVFLTISSVNGNNIVKEDIINTKSINTNLGSDVNANVNILEQLKKHYIIVKPEPIIKIPKIKPTPIKPKESPIFTITSYDLSINSCSKSRGDVGFGITKNGTSLKNKYWKDIKIISADPRIIPLNKKVRLTFIDPKYKKYNSEYLVGDTGNKVKNNHIDLYIGDYSSGKQARDFGITEAYVEIIKEQN